MDSQHRIDSVLWEQRARRERHDFGVKSHLCGPNYTWPYTVTFVVLLSAQQYSDTVVRYVVSRVLNGTAVLTTTTTVQNFSSLKYERITLS